MSENLEKSIRTVGDREFTYDEYVGKVKIDGDVDLHELVSVPDGFNPVVNGSLVLPYVISVPIGFSPVVSGDLFLNRLVSVPEGFNPSVGGNLYIHQDCLPKGFPYKDIIKFVRE